MNFDEARAAVLALLRQQGKAKNSEMLALIGGDAALLGQVREALLFAELAEDIRGAGLRHAEPEQKTVAAADTGPVKLFLSYGRRDASALAERLRAKGVSQQFLTAAKAILGEKSEVEGSERVKVGVNS